MKHSPQTRARAARLLREGKPNPHVALATKTSIATIKRWKKEPVPEPDRGAGRVDARPVQVRVPESDVLEHAPCAESRVWLGDGCVLGSLLVEGATHLRAVFLTTPERVQAARHSLEQKLVPVLGGERTCLLAPAALGVLQDDPEALALLTRICTLPPAEAFRAFLSLWHFRAQETKDVRLLGEHLWEAQELFIREIAAHPHVYALKARKLGQSTIACAYDGFVLRFRDENARVHLFSRREKAALELLEAVKFGLQRLPAWLSLPVSRTTAREFELDAGPHDRRLAVTYPTTEDTAVEATATHTHIDEWADMPRPDRILASLEPTFSASGCSSLLVTTGNGPANPSAEYWRRCLAGAGLHHPVFIPATARPDRNEAWLAEKRRTMLADAFSTEYALTWEQALAGRGGHVFTAAEVAGAMELARPLVQSAQPGRKYVIAWDIGSREDYSVGIVLDVSEEVFDVACYVRLKGDYPRGAAAAPPAPDHPVLADADAARRRAPRLPAPGHQLRPGLGDGTCDRPRVRARSPSLQEHRRDQQTSLPGAQPSPRLQAAVLDRHHHLDARELKALPSGRASGGPRGGSIRGAMSPQ